MRSPIAFALLAATTAAMIAIPAAANRAGTNGRIVFARFDPARGDDHIYTANPDGSHEQQLLPTGAEGPRWSPDGAIHVVLARVAAFLGPSTQSSNDPFNSGSS